MSTAPEENPPRPLDLDLLALIVGSYQNVPPGIERPFWIVERDDNKTVLRHPGLQGKDFLPDWVAVRRLTNAGYLEVKMGIEDSAIGRLQRRTLDITERGFAAARANAASATQDTKKKVPPVSDQETPPASNEVFVIHGRNRAVRDLVMGILRAVSVFPIDFEQAVETTGSASPYIGDVLTAAFARAQAVVVIFSNDEQVELREEFRGPGERSVSEYQPRPNVIFEAGMALGLHPDRTIILEFGSLRPITDLAGRHVVRWSDGSPQVRDRFLQKLQTAGCAVNRASNDWMTVGQNIELRTEPLEISAALRAPRQLLTNEAEATTGSSTSPRPSGLSQDEHETLKELVRRAATYPESFRTVLLSWVAGDDKYAYQSDHIKGAPVPDDAKLMLIHDRDFTAGLVRERFLYPETRNRFTMTNSLFNAYGFEPPS